MNILQCGKMSELEPIIKYKMNEMEAKAFKIAIIWQEECQREIPKEPFVKLKRNADPRKSTLFKYCYKLAREMKGILEDKDLRTYVRSQIQILKSIREGDIHALIEPHCLVGEKAWKRWKIWLRMHKKKLGTALTSDQIGVSTKESKVVAELKNTRSFLESKGCLNYGNFAANSKDIQRWSNNGEISYFYLLLSPWIKKIYGEDVPFDFDKVYYRSAITPTVEEFFRNEFKHETE